MISFRHSFSASLHVLFFLMNKSLAESPSVKITDTGADFVVERKNVSLFCNSSGKPKVSITWTRVGSSEVLSKTSILTVVNVSSPGTPDIVIQYQCSGDNGVGSPAIAVANITILCKYVPLAPLILCGRPPKSGPASLGSPVILPFIFCG